MMPILFALKEMMWNIIASTIFGIACLLPFVVSILLLSSSSSAFRIAYPPFDNTSSILSLARDSSFAPPYDVNGDEEGRNDSKFSGKSGDGGKTVHFCFLVHGFQGFSGDLSYFETILKHRASIEKNQQFLKQKSSRRPDQLDTDDDFVIVPPITDKKNGQPTDPTETQDMVVHNAVCNEGKTKDGVIKGGDRLMDEMKEIIHSNMKQRYPEIEYDKENDETAEPNKLYDITISMIGNSMGGLYSRYAIAKLIERHCVGEAPPSTSNCKNECEERGTRTWILFGKYRLRLDIFCTTATPHLGVSEHTWIPIPRIAEIGVAATMGETGRDLFRLNDLLYTMSTDSAFLDPLSCFRKRIAYANCYGTDFPVPVGTAAFLSDKSSHPHRFLNNCRVGDDCDLVTASLMTSANKEMPDTSESLDELHHMSISLDRLGWKKIFVDLQKEMLSVTLPIMGYGAESKSGMNLSGLKNSKEIVTSKEIADVVHRSNSNNDNLILRAPFGHNMIVAFSRDRFSTFLNKGGRPLVEALAKDLVEDIFAADSMEKESF